MMKRLILFSLLGILTTALPAAERLMIVGGGPLPKDSQVSIERNVVWIDRLTDNPGYEQRQLLFTAGPDKIRDIIEQRADDELLQRYLPLSRIFGEQYDALSAFRPNRIRNITGPSTARSVEQQLSQALGDLAPGDSLWFIYNGHGGRPSSEPSKNTLRLWNNTTLDVQGFADIAQARPQGTILRSFMPQCFSGGFARSIALSPERPDSQSVDPLQCGFYSVPADQESEGCTISVDTGQYRDYSTFFFAALTGRTRNGEPVKPEATKTDPPTLLDAHRWAYVNGNSTDIPFTSSEYFLELWQPWYLRWHSINQISGDNPYYPLAAGIANRLGIDAGDPRSMAREAARLREQADAQIESIRQELGRLSTEERKLRRGILIDFQRQFPEAVFPYNANWPRRLALQERTILGAITSHADYPRLEQLQNEIDAGDQRLLDQQRDRASILRLQRMLRLSTLYELFQRFADPDERNNYEMLVACESWAPPVNGYPRNDADVRE